MKWNKKWNKVLLVVAVLMVFVCTMSITAFAAKGDVAGAVQSTWNTAKIQIKNVVNNVVFPVIDLILAVCFFVKVALVYMDYRKHGQLEWTPCAILFASLIFALTAPLYIWQIIGI